MGVSGIVLWVGYTYLIFAVDPKVLECRMRHYLCCKGNNAGQDDRALHR
jgi:hypothetical protein